MDNYKQVILVNFRLNDQSGYRKITEIMGIEKMSLQLYYLLITAAHNLNRII